MKNLIEEKSSEINKTNETEKIYSLKPKTVKEIVIENQEILKNLKTPKEFYEFAIENNLDKRTKFPHFKKSLLKELNIDYAGLKIQKKEEFENDLKNQIKQEISLTTDAWGKYARYAIARPEDGEPISYGKFYQYSSLEQSEAELEAAKYAIGVVAKMMKDNNIPALKLNLTVDAQWLLHQDKYRNKGSELKRLANSKKIFLNTIWESGSSICADHFTRIKGFLKTDYYLLKKSLKPVNWNDLDENSNGEFEVKKDLNSDLKNQEKANQSKKTLAMKMR